MTGLTGLEPSVAVSQATGLISPIVAGDDARVSEASLVSAHAEAGTLAAARALRTCLAWALPVLALVYLCTALAAWALTGGSTFHVLGQRILLVSPRSPILICLGLLTLWAALSPAAAEAIRAWFNSLSIGAHLRLAWALGAGTAGWLGIVKTWQHYTLNTGAYDLGLQANVVWNCAHGHPWYSSLEDQVYLADHFSPFLQLLSPLAHLPDVSLALLWLQSVGIGLAVVALYRLALGVVGTSWAGMVLVTLFLFNPYVHEVSRFDFHPIALAIPLFMGMLLFVEEERPLGFIVLAVLAATVEETLMPPLVALGLYAAWRSPRMRVAGLVVSLLSLGYFVLEMSVWMPAVAGHGKIFKASRYANLGGSLPEIAGNLLQNPFLLVKAVLTPSAKAWTLLSVLGLVGFLPLLAPAQLLLLAVPYVSVVASCSPNQYQLTDHYSATTLPFLFCAAAFGLSAAVRRARAITPPASGLWHPRVAIVLVLGLALAGFLRSPDYVAPWSPTRVATVHRLMDRIPDGVAVCAMQPFVPHLANRHQVTMFGDFFRGSNHDIGEAVYLLLDGAPDTCHAAYPMTVADCPRIVKSLRDSGRYRVEEEAGGILLLRKLP